MAGLSPSSTASGGTQSGADFKKQLNQVYTWYTGGFLIFVVVRAIAEREVRCIQLVVLSQRGLKYAATSVRITVAKQSGSGQ